jgi:opacity protein-like surface antigen
MIKSKRSWLKSLGLCSATAVLTALPLQAAEQAAYLTLDGGVSLMQDVKIESAKLGMDTGYRVDLAGGYELNQWAAIELESGFIYNEFKDSNGDAWLGMVPILANAVFRYENQTKFVPFVGAGAGGAFSILQAPIDSDTDFVFAWQLMAGVDYKIGKNMCLGVKYKYFSTCDQSYDIGNGAGIKLKDIATHSVGVAFTWHF